MHPEVRKEKGGMCPQCGMNLIPLAASETHDHKHRRNAGEADKHAGHVTSSFLTKFWISLAISVPVFFYSEMAHMLFGVRGPEFFGWQYVMLALGSVVFFYCGWIFIASAYRELRARLPGMMTLIAIAITTTYLYSVVSIVMGTGHDLLFELVSLITIMLLGHWIEMKSVQGAKGALRELAKLLPDTAEVIREGRSMIIPLSEVIAGDIVVVKPGAQIPADSVIIEGSSEVNESIITGESRPLLKNAGDTIIAGSINGDGSLRARVATIGEHTFLAGVMRLVAEAESSKSRLQLLSDKAALYLTFIALSAGGLTFVLWLLADAGIIFATERLVAVLVIACPHALGLAVPLVASISTTMAAQNGFLVKRRVSLEAARTINVVLFDKTGTLTEAAFSVTNSSSDESLALAAAVEAHSEHPIGKAILAEAMRRKLVIEDATEFSRLSGVGAEARVAGKRVFVGHRGAADITVEVDGNDIGTISLSDAPRPEAREAVDALKHMGIKVAMITGDSEDVAREVAATLGIDEYFARVLPGEKSEKVKLLQRGGAKVAMVGDGVNDAPALTQADLGIAIGAGTNVAIESAGIILVRNDPRDISKIIRLSKLTYTKMIQNLFWATGYNIVALPLAAGLLYAQGIILEPAIAAILMSLSTVIVAVNAVLLRKNVL